MKEKIITYLKGPRSYAEGMTLYEQYGANLRLKATFRRLGDTELTRVTLLDELRRLAGLSEQQFRNLPRLAAVPAVAETRAEEAEIRAEDAEARAEEAEARAEEAVGNTPASDELKEMVGFRDRYPFLRDPHCPDVLKVAVSDMFAAYDRYRAAHAALAELPDDADLQRAERLAAEAVENYLQDRALLDELNHYRDHGTLLGKHPAVAAVLHTASLRDLSDLDVEKVRKNAASNASKWKKKLEECTFGTDDYTRCADGFRRWELTRQEAEKELEDRKKKNA